MAFINSYPYSDFHELNLDWVIEKTQEAATLTDYIKENVETIVKADIDEAIDKYFNSIMIDAVYDSETETITLMKEVVATDATHTYSADDTSMTIS